MLRHTLALLSLWLTCVTCAGCATHADRLRGVRQDFFSGELQQAAEQIDKQLGRRSGDTDVWQLDRAMVELAAGRPAEAERLLREVRDRFDHLEQADATEAARALLTDDQARAYSGEDYEKILIRALLAMANLMQDGSDAGAYALQTADKQQQILQRLAASGGNDPPPEFQRVALGPYLQGLLREQTHSNYDDVARAYAQVVSWQPDFRPGPQDLQRATQGHHSNRGNGVLYAFTLVGRGPYKEESEEIPTTVAMLIADRLLSALGDQTVPPTIAPVKVPRVVVAANRIQTVQVLVDGQPAGQTETITDVSQFAVQQHQAVFADVLARAVVRRAVKKGIICAGKEATGIEKDSLVSFALDMGGVAWEATEAADTRCWGLLPDKIQVLRLELPAGRHQITLIPARGSQALGSVNTTEVEIFDGGNSYLMANFPDDRLVGKILTAPNQ